MSKQVDVEELITALQCFSCKDVPGPGAQRRDRYACVNESHALCTSCKLMCACGSPVGKKPSPYIGHFLREGPWMCFNFKNGCRETKNHVEDLGVHQRNCIYREIFCPFIACRKELVFIEKDEHFKNKHPEGVQNPVQIADGKFIFLYFWKGGHS